MKHLPWPIDGAQLFIKQGDCRELSHFGWGDVSAEFSGYADGYKEAADLLIVKSIESGDRRTLDTFVYPILFLYRQYLELEMKWLILKFDRLDKDNKKQFLKDVNHNLMHIWKRLKPLLQESDDQTDRHDVEIIESYIKQFHEFDKNSFTFRYPINKQLEKMIIEEHRLNLKFLKQRMQEVYNYFDGVHCWLGELKEYEDDLAQYLQ